MSNGFPCPNPTCSHVFSPDAVKGAAVLTCPRCGTVYQFRVDTGPAVTAPARAAPKSASAQKVAPPPPAKKAPPPPPTIPVGKIVAQVPVAPVAPRAPAEPAPSKLQFSSNPDVLVPPSKPDKQRGKRSGLRRLLFAALVFLSLCTAAGAIIYIVRGYLPEEDEAEQKHNKTHGNFAFKAPRGWKFDDSLRARFHVNLAMTRQKPRTHLGLFYRDYEKRSPGDGELLDVALRRLRGYFVSQVEYEDPLQKENKGRSGQLGGEPAIVLEFEATDSNNVTMRGQCFMLTRQGYAYWLFTWGPNDDELREELQKRWDALREGFTLLDEREGWRPQPRKTEEYRGTKVPFVLNFPTDVWRKEENAKDYELHPEMALLGYELVENEETGTKRPDKYAGKSATVQVLVLDKAADVKAGAAAAREFITKLLTDVRPSLKIEDVKDRKTGKPIVTTEVGAMRGQVHKLRLQAVDEPEKYGRLAVVNRDAGLLVIYCECRWDRREYWDQEFKALLETVRPGDKGR